MSTKTDDFLKPNFETKGSIKLNAFWIYYHSYKYIGKYLMPTISQEKHNIGANIRKNLISESTR